MNNNYLIIVMFMVGFILGSTHNEINLRIKSQIKKNMGRMLYA